jgi:serine/threonine-protein kinase
VPGEVRRTPNIAAVYDLGEADGCIFIAMELVHGETLRARVESGLIHAEAVRVALEIAARARACP